MIVVLLAPAVSLADDLPVADTKADAAVTHDAMQKVAEFASTKLWPRCDKLDSVQAMATSQAVPADIQTAASPSMAMQEIWEVRLCDGRFLFRVAFWTDGSGHAKDIVQPMGPIFGPN